EIINSSEYMDVGEKYTKRRGRSTLKREQELFQGLPSKKIAKSNIIHEEQLIAAKQRYEIKKDIESYKRSTRRKAYCFLHEHAKLNNDTDSN
ncbi:unnamed protein product, partial [Didymodactylos carnosus]